MSSMNPTKLAEVLPPLPGHPEPRTMKWSELELRAIREYGVRCARAALEAAQAEAKPAPAVEPLTDEAATALVQSVVRSSDRPIGMVAYGLLIGRAFEAAHGIAASKKENL